MLLSLSFNTSARPSQALLYANALRPRPPGRSPGLVGCPGAHREPQPPATPLFRYTATPRFPHYDVSSYQETELRDLETKKVRAYLEQRGRVNCLAYSRDGKTLISASYRSAGDKMEELKGEIRLWGTANGKELARLTEGIRVVTALALSPDGATLVVRDQVNLADRSDAEVKLIDVKSGRVRVLQKKPSQVLATLHYAPDGTLYVLQAEDTVVNLYAVKK